MYLTIVYTHYSIIYIYTIFILHTIYSLPTGERALSKSCLLANISRGTPINRSSSSKCCNSSAIYIHTYIDKVLLMLYICIPVSSNLLRSAESITYICMKKKK